MKNINLKLKNLAILSIFVIGTIIAPSTSYARIYGRTCGEGGCNYNFETAPGLGSSSSTSSATYVQRNAVTYVNSAIPTVSSSTAVARRTTTTAKKVTAKNTKTEPKEDLSTLPANVIYGSNTFVPSGLLQWILLAILILIIVILSRKVFNGEKKFHSSPMKHA